MEDVDRRLTQAERSICDLYGKVNDTAVMQAGMKVTLDNLNTTMQELKVAVQNLKERPSRLWDRLVCALTGAAACALIAYVMNLLIGG